MPNVFTDYATPYGMKVATYSGLLSSARLSLPPPAFSCLTGNCTWEPFSTLAISSQCVNITSHVSLNCTASGDNQSCNFVAPPDDPTLQHTLEGSNMTTPFMMESINLLEDWVLPVLSPYANVTGFLAMAQWVKALGDLNSSETTGGALAPNTTFEAGRCFYYLSVIEIQAQVENGVYSENTLQEYTSVENPLTSPTYTLNTTGEQYYMANPFNDGPTLIYKPPFANTPPNVNDTFVVSPNVFAVVGSQIPEILNGQVVTGSSSGALGTSDIIQMLYEADNVTQALQNMAIYMTNEIRSSDSEALQNELKNASVIASNQTVAGTTWVPKQFITVEWAWLGLPFALLILAIFLLLAAYWETRTSRIGVWESSPLALFFHGQLSGECKTVVDCDKGALNTADSMRVVAEGLRARIMKGANGMIEIYEIADSSHVEPVDPGR
jgi:hypothetical protein